MHIRKIIFHQNVNNNEQGGVILISLFSSALSIL